MPDPKPVPPDPIERLEQLRSHYGAAARSERDALIQRIEGSSIDEPEALVRYNDLLLFARAYPDDAAMLARVERALGRISGRVRTLGDRAEEFRDTGLPGSYNVHTYSWSMLRELLATYPDALELHWEEIDDSSGYFELASLCAAQSEVLGIDDDRLEGDTWMLAARSTQDRGDLAVLYRMLESSRLPEHAREILFDRLRLPIRWAIGSGEDARTTSIRRRKQIHFHREPLQREALDLAVEMKRPLPPVERLDLAEARSAIRWMKSAQSVRNRELYPLCHPEERDVVRVPLERGLEIYCFGVRPPRRLLVEGLYGQFLVKNGVPIGYALSSVIGRVCEIGLNVYDTYRAGENAFLYAQMMRTFHHLYGAEWFWVPRLQAGYGNDEGLQSGAFWFYDKLGFRSLDPKVRSAADRERERRLRDPSYRAGISTLRRLVTEDLFWAPAGVEEPGPYPLGALGLAVTRWISDRFGGDRERASVWAEREARKRLGLRVVSRSGQAEQEAFHRLAPLVAMIPDWSTWPNEERNRLARLVRAKGSTRETSYLELSRQLPRWLRFLRSFAPNLD
ncbi:MAG: hypothetical protein IPK72_18230 [Candidatus Eisenbacteria bacterium]|nr:hypothetical protein [Candidatus Eisenbacteria bacterium]